MFDGFAAGQARVARHQVEFVSPLVFRREPVLVDSWVTGPRRRQVALAHEVYDEQEARAHRFYLRVSSVLDHRLDEPERALAERCTAPDHEWRELSTTAAPTARGLRVQVRRSDLDERGQVSDGVRLRVPAGVAGAAT